MSETRILIVEDDTEVGKLISMTLKASHYAYTWSKDGNSAITDFKIFKPDIVLLDLGLPDIDGVEVIKKIRINKMIPIIVISARSEESEKIKALDEGADDYLVKPFSVNEMLARIRVALRRLKLIQDVDEVEVKDYQNRNLRIDYAARTAYLDNKALTLTETTFNLLCLFAKNTAKVLTHGYIMRTIWKDKPINDTVSLRVAIASLRKEIEPNEDSTKYIQTHIGVGYSFIQH